MYETILVYIVLKNWFLDKSNFWHSYFKGLSYLFCFASVEIEVLVHMLYNIFLESSSPDHLQQLNATLKALNRLSLSIF